MINLVTNDFTTDFTTNIPVIEEALDKITRCIVESFHPIKIILFGSYAYGKPNPDSDIDLLVVMEDDDAPARRSTKVAQMCRLPYIAMDILVQTPEEIEKRLAGFDPFLEEIFTKGRFLYDATR